MVLLLATGSFRERVTALVDKWNTGAEAARTGEGSGSAASGSAEKPLPLKCQLWAAVAAQLVEQGVDEPVKSTLLATPHTAIEASYIKPSQDSDRPLTFALLIRDNLEGLNTRAALSSRAAQTAVAKTAEGVWPPLDL